LKARKTGSGSLFRILDLLKRRYIFNIKYNESGNKLRIGIIGIGGVGGYFGGKLAREFEKSSEHEIIFIARGEHLKAIQKNGLHLFTKEGDGIAWPNIATDNPAVAGLFDLVFFCTKSYSLETQRGNLPPAFVKTRWRFHCSMASTARRGFAKCCRKQMFWAAVFTSFRTLKRRESSNRKAAPAS